MLLLPGWFLYLFVTSRGEAKWVEGRIDTKDNWAFLARFCFLSFEGQFEYLIEYEKEMGIPNLLLYYDDDSQWPAVYHSSKSCKEREDVLNRGGQNQIVRLSHWYPETEFSGCILRKANRELPASKSTSSTQNPATTTPKPKNKNSTNLLPPEPSYYDQFLKTTPRDARPIPPDVNTTWYELLPTDDFNFTTTMVPEEELWESISPEQNGSHFGKLNDVEILFDNENGKKHKIKRSLDLYERFRRRRIHAESKHPGSTTEKEKLLVSCHNSRRFRSARERWWFIAISNCENDKGLDVKYKFLMTNGPDGDFWHEHFSADEFYVLPVLLAYTFAYVIVMIAVVMCSVELKSRHLLHSTYKLFLFCVVAQHFGITLNALSYISYATHGTGSENARIVGQFICGVSEMTFILLMVLMAKGYTITRGRLKVGFTVKLTVFMCCYIVTYIVLFVYQAKAFDPGEVLYLYESPAGYGLIVLRITAWCMFAYSTFFTVRKYPEKNVFYCPFFICGTLWFYAGPLFILTANSYIDKWVRESVVTAVLLFISFSGHIMFLILTLPVFANKNFPYHVRTTQIGVMEVTGNSALDGFGPNAYHPTNAPPQTVIIPLTRRTEELIGNMYSQYIASAPPLSIEDQLPKLNGFSKKKEISPKHRLLSQDSTETNSSADIKPTLTKGEPPKEIFTVESQISKMEHQVLPAENITYELPEDKNILNLENGDLPLVSRSRRNLLEPIKREDNVPSWSLAKGPCIVGMQRKAKSADEDVPEVNNHLINGRKVPPVRNGLQPSSGEISTIHEGRIQSYKNNVSKATIDLFSVGTNKG
ncbi:unnamed protein product [Arctia plantaginis]|uniref:Intimal thickness related receptor IRP domain-containing protein n=1 Tax=Arctia plantaginis TaxID=874455 RepID=A0A8S0ZJS2_ARCPL|nr:unnamed protein product [Arctia plantaginis]